MLRLATLLIGALGLLASPATAASQLSPRTQAVLELDRAYLQANPQALRTITNGNLTASSSFNLDVAKKLLWLTTATYCANGPALQQWTASPCKQFGDFTVTQVMSNANNQGYVGYFTQGLPGVPIPGSPLTANDKYVTVSFRGTVPSNLDDWIEDLNFAEKSSWPGHPEVKVHQGFWGAYTDLRDGMLKGLDAAFKATGAKGLIITGHSLGGAMAELAALDIKLNYYPDKWIGVYTIGCPRPGDSNFASLYASQITASFRDIHYRDVVPHLPPLMLGFQHSPTEVFWDEPMASYKVCNASNGEDPACANSLLFTLSVDDHLHYYGIMVHTYCQNGVQVDNEEQQQQTLQALPQTGSPMLKLKASINIVLSEQ